MLVDLERVLPKIQILSDLEGVLNEADRSVELEGQAIVVPKNSTHEVVARSWHTYEVPVGFGDHYRALVALGGIEGVTAGVVHAHICFATLWYSEQGRLITVDFSKKPP